jgi:hypothetical protein
MPRRAPLRPIRDVVAELGDGATPAALPAGYGRSSIQAAIDAGEIRYRPDGVLEPTPRVGRPPRAAEAATRRIDIKVTEEEEELLRAAASAAGVGLRRYIADAATARAAVEMDGKPR